MFQNGPWTWRGRTWSGPPCSVRTSSILLVAPRVAPLSKCQHLLHHLLHHYQNVSKGRQIQCKKDQMQVVEKSSIVPYSIYKEYLNQTLGLTLSTLVLVDSWFVFEMRAFVIHGTRCPSLSVWNSFVVKLSYPAVVPFLSSSLLTLYCHGPRSGGLLLHWPGCCAIYWTKSKLTCIPSSSSCKMRTLCPNTTKCLA